MGPRPKEPDLEEWIHGIMRWDPVWPSAVARKLPYTEDALTQCCNDLDRVVSCLGSPSSAYKALGPGLVPDFVTKGAAQLYLNKQYASPESKAMQSIPHGINCVYGPVLG